MEEEVKYEVQPEEREPEPKGVPWERFKPGFDAKAFARAMREAGLTSHEAVTKNQRAAMEVLRKHWQMSLAAVNDFARTGGK